MKEYKAFSPEELFKQLAEGNKKAYHEIYERYRKTVFLNCNQFVHSDAIAEDLLQEVFLRVWTQRQHFANVKKWEAYLSRLTRNVVNRHLKKTIDKEKKYPALFSFFSASRDKTRDPSFILEFKKLVEKVEQEINKLPAQQRKAMQLILQGYTVREIAEEMKTSVHTAKQHIKSGRSKIRKSWDELD